MSNCPWDIRWSRSTPIPRRTARHLKLKNLLRSIQRFCTPLQAEIMRWTSVQQMIGDSKQMIGLASIVLQVTLKTMTISWRNQLIYIANKHLRKRHMNPGVFFAKTRNGSRTWSMGPAWYPWNIGGPDNDTAFPKGDPPCAQIAHSHFALALTPRLVETKYERLTIPDKAVSTTKLPTLLTLESCKLN